MTLSTHNGIGSRPPPKRTVSHSPFARMSTREYSFDPIRQNLHIRSGLKQIDFHSLERRNWIVNMSQNHSCRLTSVPARYPCRPLRRIPDRLNSTNKTASAPKSFSAPRASTFCRDDRLDIFALKPFLSAYIFQ